MKTPVNKKTLSQHFTYNWWKYALLAVLVIFGTDMLYTMTAYRPPEEKKVEFYVYGYTNSDELNAYMEAVGAEYMPDMEVMSSQMLMNVDTYGNMQLTTYMAAGEGDLYLLPRDEFIASASNGAFVALEQNAELMAIFDEAGISLQSGWRKNTDTGDTHLYGIPQSKLPGLARYAYAEDGYLCVLAANGNDENVMTFLRVLCRDMLTPTEEAESTDAPAAESTGN